VIKRLKEESDQVIHELVATDATAQKVYESYSAFAKDVAQYHRLSEQAYINTRDE